MQFATREEALKAVEKGNGMKLNGRLIVVDLALPKHQFDSLMTNAKEELAASGPSDEKDEDDEDDDEEDEDEDEEGEDDEDEDDESAEEDDSEGEDENEEQEESDEENEKGPGKNEKTSGKSLDTVENRTVFLRNLLFETTEEELSECLEQFGKILYSKIVRSEFGMSRGTGFVKFESPESATKCIKAAIVTEQKRVVPITSPSSWLWCPSFTTNLDD